MDSSSQLGSTISVVTAKVESFDLLDDLHPTVVQSKVCFIEVLLDLCWGLYLCYDSIPLHLYNIVIIHSFYGLFQTSSIGSYLDISKSSSKLNQSFCELARSMRSFFVDALNPVHPKAQSKVNDGGQSRLLLVFKVFMSSILFARINFFVCSHSGFCSRGIGFV